MAAYIEVNREESPTVENYKRVAIGCRIQHGYNNVRSVTRSLKTEGGNRTIIKRGLFRKQKGGAESVLETARRAIKSKNWGKKDSVTKKKVRGGGNHGKGKRGI